MLPRWKWFIARNRQTSYPHPQVWAPAIYHRTHYEYTARFHSSRFLGSKNGLRIASRWSGTIIENEYITSLSVFKCRPNRVLCTMANDDFPIDTAQMVANFMESVFYG